MSVHAKCLNYFHEIVNAVGIELEGIRLLEYGNLHSKQTARNLMTKWGYERQGAMKRYFQQLGVIDISIDINGRDGALKLDLSKPILDKSLVGTFDILFDAGTSEHIDSQIGVWANTFSFLKEGGLAIHILPLAGSYNKHGTWKFDIEWIEWYTTMCKLQPVDFRIMGNHYMYYCKNRLQTCFAYIRTKDSIFPFSDIDWKDPVYDERGRLGDIEHYGKNLEKVRNATS